MVKFINFFKLSVLTLAVLVFAGAAQAAPGGNKYYAKSTLTVSGSGFVYAATSSGEGTYVSGSSSSGTKSTTSKGGSVSGFYAYAFPGFGCKFNGWGTTSGQTSGFVSTLAQYGPYSLYASSSKGDTQTTTYYACFSSSDESLIKDVYLAVGDSVQLYFYNSGSGSHFWSARANTTFLTSNSDTSPSGAFAKYKRSMANTAKGTSFNITVTASSVSGSSYDQLTIQDYEGNVYHYRIHVIAARVVYVGESTNCVVNSFASKTWSASTSYATYVSPTVSPSTATDSATATVTGKAVTDSAKLVKVTNYATSTTTGALGATYNLYVAVQANPKKTYHAAMATEVVDQDESKDWGNGWAYASREKIENSDIYQTTRSITRTVGEEVEATETSAAIDGFYIFAFPNIGYKFTGWSKNDPNGAIVSTDAYFDTSLSVVATSTDSANPTIDTYYAHFEKDESMIQDITLAVGDTVKLGFYNAEKAYTWSFQSIWTNQNEIVKEQVLNLDTTNWANSAYLAYKRSSDTATASNAFSLDIQAIARSGVDFDQLTLEDCNGNVYHYRIRVTDPRVYEIGSTNKIYAASIAEKTWSVSNVNVAVASATPATAEATNRLEITSEAVSTIADKKTRNMTFNVGNYTETTTTGERGAEYSLSVHVVYPHPVDFCQGDSVVIYYHNPNPKTWYLLINGTRFEANEVGYGDRMNVLLTASNPDTDTEILGTTSQCETPDGKSDLVVVTDGENFYAYRMGVWPKRLIEIGQSTNMTCSTVATHPWRVQVGASASPYVDVASELNINDGHSARVTITGKEPKSDVTIYVANFKDDGSVNAQGAYYVLKTDVKGAPTRKAYISKGVEVTWGENYELATGETAYTVDPATSNKMHASVAQMGSAGASTTLSVDSDAIFGDKALFTVNASDGKKVVKYEVTAYAAMSMAVGQVAPGCLVGSAIPWVVWSSDQTEFPVSSVLYNELWSGRVEAKKAGDYWLWATNASDTVSWYAMRAQVYDEKFTRQSIATNATVTFNVKDDDAQLSAVWSVSKGCDHVTATLDNTTAPANSVNVTINGGTHYGTHQVYVNNAYHHETIEVFVGAEEGYEVIYADSLAFLTGTTYDIPVPSGCSSSAWTAIGSENAAGVFTVEESGSAGEQVTLTGVTVGNGQAIVKYADAKKIYVYEVEVQRTTGRLPSVIVGVNYTITTNLTDISSALAGATMRTTGDRMIAESSVANGVLTIKGLQDGTTEIELQTANAVYTLPIIVHLRDINKNMTLYVGANGSVSTYTYKFDSVIAYTNKNPDRLDVIFADDGKTMTLQPKSASDGLCQVEVDCFVDGLSESSRLIYGITIKDIGGGYKIWNYDQGFIAYKGERSIEEVDGELVMVYKDTSNAGGFKIPDGYNGKMDILAVGGGGGGGSVATGFGRGGGGGGAGGFAYLENKKMVSGSFGVQVGEGGIGIEGSITGRSERGAPGGTSLITNSYGYVMIMGNGGGGGGAPEVGQYAGEDGGSGGGGSWISSNTVDGVDWIPGRGGIGVDGQGCDGGTPTETNCGGGGGGAMGNGGDGQTRGPGRYSTITGESVLYSLGGFGGRSDVATPAADGAGPGFGGDGGNGGPGGDGGAGVVVMRLKRLYKNVLVPVPTTNDLVTSRFLWEEDKNCVPFQYQGRSFRSKSDSHPYNWEDVIDSVTGTTNIVCELGGEGGTNKVGVGYYNFYVTLKEGYAWEDGDDPYGSTKKMSYRWVVVDDWNNIDAALSINKTVWWSDKSNATVRVTSNASPETSGGGVPKVLFLGSLCGGHGFTSDILNTALNAVTAVGDVDYYFFNRTFNLNGTSSIYDEDDPPYFYGSLTKGQTRSGTVYALNPNGSDARVALESAAGNHGTMNGFYNQIYCCITNGTAATYDYIMFSFDRARLAERFEEACPHEAEVAEFLKPYYENEKVIWLVDEESDEKEPSKSTLPQTPWYPSQLTSFSGTYWESLDTGVKYWQSSSTILAGWASEKSYAYVPYNALVGLMCPSNYPIDKATYMENVLPDMSGTVAWDNETLQKVRNMACTGIKNQCVYNDSGNVSNLIASAVKAKPFNLYYKDKIVSPAKGLTIQSVYITVCTKGSGGVASTNESDWVAIRHWDAKTGAYYDDDPTHATGVKGSTMLVDMTNNLVTACLSNIDFQVWVRYDTHVLDADGVFCSSEDAKYNESTGQYEKNPNDGQAYLAMIDDLGVGIGVEGEGETEVPWRYTAYPIVGSVQNGSIFVAGSRLNQMSCAEGRDITVYYRGNGGYRLAALTVDGKNIQIGSGYDNSYTFYNLSAAHTISAVYTPYYGTINTYGSTVEYDGGVHVPSLILKGWDETYDTQIRYSLTADGEYYNEAEFCELYATNRELTCVGEHLIYCRAYAWQTGYGATLDEAGWVWVDTRVVEMGTVTITPKPLALTAVSFIRKGEEVPKTLNEWCGVTVTGLVEGDTINTNDTVLTWDCPDYQPVMGQYPIWPKIIAPHTDYDIVGTNYTLSLLPGVVSIEKGAMNIGGVHQFSGLDPENQLVDTGVARVEKIYDGVATNIYLDIIEPTASADRRVFYSYDNGVTWTDTYDPEKFLGVGTNKVWYAVEQGDDYASSVYFWVTNYNYVIINKRPLTITAASATKRYDTTALTDAGYEITSGELADGDILVSTRVTGSQTVVGSSANVASEAVIRCCPNGVDDGLLTSGRTDDYEITYVDGTLTVTPGAITIGDVTYIPGQYIPENENGVSDAVKTYDGLGTNIVVHVTTPSSGYEVYYSTNNMRDAVIEWASTMSFTNAGTYVVHFLVEADNYATVTNYARVIINPREVTATVQDNRMKLGSSQPGYKVVYTYSDTGEMVPDEISKDFVFNLAVTNSEIVVGTCDIVAQGEKTQGNYTFTTVPGTLTVTDKDFINYSVQNVVTNYDGKGHSSVITVDPGVTGNVTVEYSLSTNGPWSTTAPVVTNATTGVPIYYRIHSDAGTYLDEKGEFFVTINPLPITVTANSAEKFDGDPNPPLSAKVTGTFAEGESEDLISYTLSVSSEAIGTNQVVVSGGLQQNNYKITYVNATFIVKDWTYPAGPDKEPIPMDREWIKEQLGTNELNYATASNFYYGVGQNGVTNWMNYVLGLEPTNVNSVIYLDIEQNLSAVTNPTLIARGATVRPMSIGSLTNVSYRLLKCSTSPTGTYERVEDRIDGRFPQQNVPIEYFRVDTRFLFESSAK